MFSFRTEKRMPKTPTDTSVTHTTQSPLDNVKTSLVYYCEEAWMLLDAALHVEGPVHTSTWHLELRWNQCLNMNVLRAFASLSTPLGLRSSANLPSLHSHAWWQGPPAQKPVSCCRRAFIV